MRLQPFIDGPARCKFRRKAEHAGDYVHEPMTWTLNNATRERECVELPDMTGWTMEDKQEVGASFCLVATLTMYQASTFPSVSAVRVVTIANFVAHSGPV